MRHLWARNHRLYKIKHYYLKHRIIHFCQLFPFALNLLKNSETPHTARLQQCTKTKKQPQTLICAEIVFNASSQSETGEEDQRLALKTACSLSRRHSVVCLWITGVPWVHCTTHFVWLHFSFLSNEIRQG